MTPTTKLVHPFHCLLERGGEPLTASFSNFVVAIPRDSDQSPMRARPLAPWAKFLLLLLLVVLLMVLALVAFAVAQQGGKGVGAARSTPAGPFSANCCACPGPLLRDYSVENVRTASQWLTVAMVRKR